MMTQDTKEAAVTVREFLEAAQGAMEVTVEAGEEYLGNVIQEGSLNRPGLALAGFYQYFAHKRIQVLGLAELTYLKSMSSQDRQIRIREFFNKHIPCVAITRNRHPSSEIKEMAEVFQVPVLRSPMITMHFINAATIIIEELTSPRIKAQGTLVDIMGIGVLLEGEPGIGKSETCLALIERGHSLVSDDVTILQKTSAGAIVGTPVELTRYHMEIKGLGIIHVPSLFGIASMRDSKRLDVIVRLVRPEPGFELDRTGLSPKSRKVLGIEIPFITLSVAPGRDLAHVVEVAALNQKLKNLGHDAAKELDEKLMKLLARKGAE